jgi:hypothetical protein
MFEVYLNRKGALLVVPKGLPIPTSETGRWRKKKTKVAAVNDEIRLSIQRNGYYIRSGPISRRPRARTILKPTNTCALSLISYSRTSPSRRSTRCAMPAPAGSGPASPIR